MTLGDKERLARARIGQLYDGKWHLAHLLGVGGTAAVYAARHRNASAAAVKILHPTISHDDVLCARFLREGYVANTVGHPGAVRVLDDDTADDGSVYLVMELLEGETLDARARRRGGRLPISEVLSITDQLLDVLCAAHAKGILHRDLKPENLFLTLDGQLKVLDFGIAKLGGASTSETITGTALGTPAFMAPEMALGKTELVDARTDLWAVGATMFNLLTGRFAQQGANANEVLVRAATTRVDKVRAVAPELPEALAAIVDRALEFEPAARWQDAESFQSAVRDSYYALEGRPSGGPPPLPRTIVEELDSVDVAREGGDDETTKLSQAQATGPADAAAPRDSATPPGTATVGSVTRTTRPPGRSPRAMWIGAAAAVAALTVALLLLAIGRRASAPPASRPVAAASVPAATPSTVPSAAPHGVSIDDLDPAPSASEQHPEPPQKAEPPRRTPPRFVPPRLTQPDF